MKLGLLTTLTFTLLGILTMGNIVDAQDGVLAFTPRSIIIPAISLGFSPPIEIVSLYGGLIWPAGYSHSARACVPIPEDWDKDLDSVLTIYFTPSGDEQGIVDFFIRPTGLESNGGLLNKDPGSVSGPGVEVPLNSHLRLFSQSIVIPAERVSNSDDVLYLYAIQRDGTEETFSGDLIVLSIKIAYIQQGSDSKVVNLVGDKDGFGLGLIEGDENLEWFDNRQSTDPEFTDVYPTADNVVYSHTFSIPANASISSATLRWLTLGIQDGDSQVLGSDTDLRLFVDNIEVPEAFDSVDQFHHNGTTWISFVGLVEIPLFGNALTSVYDGHIDIRIENHQLGSSGSKDSFAFDYSELELNVHSP